MSKLDRLQRPDLLSPISRLDGLSPPRGDTHAGALPSHWSPLLQQQWFASITRRDEEKQYPSGANLRAALGEHLHCSVNSLCLSAGREAALIALLSAWCWQRPVLSPAPPPSHLLRAIRTLCLPHLTLAVRSDFSLPIDHVIQRARHHEAGAVFITNPADPSGSLLSRAEIITLADHCDALIIVDETNNIQPAFSVSDAVSTRENLVVIQGFPGTTDSVSFPVTWTIASPRIVQAMECLSGTDNINPVTVATVLWALGKAGKPLFETTGNPQERERIRAELSAMAGVITWPSSADYLLIGTTIPGPRLALMMGERGISVDCFFHSPLRNCIRVSVKQPATNDRFISTMREIFEAPSPP